MSRRASPSFQTAPPGLRQALDQAAELAALLAAARAVLAGFRPEIDAGTLRPPQHAPLLLLEEALMPFGDNLAPRVVEGDVAGGRRIPPGPAAVSAHREAVK